MGSKNASTNDVVLATLQGKKKNYLTRYSKGWKSLGFITKCSSHVPNYECQFNCALCNDLSRSTSNMKNTKVEQTKNKLFLSRAAFL